MALDPALARVLREALYVALLVCAPAVVVSMAVGLVVSVLQAATQIQEPTLTFVPRLLAVFFVLAATGGWMGGELVRFARGVFTGFPTLVH